MAGFGGSVRAAKAQPVTAPKVVEHGVPAPDPAHPNAVFFALPPVVIALILSFPAPAGDKVLAAHYQRLFASGFSYSNRFRPPPAF